jgi:hypothetical protein
VTRSRIIAAAVAVLVLLALAGLGRAAPAQVSIVVTLGAGKMGSFRMTGSPTDAGRAVATRRVTRGRLVTKETLTSSRGTLVLESTQACVRATGTWKVVSGGGAYAGTRGSGTTRGRIGCTRPFKPTSVAHTGALVVPPPPLATAGMYRGWTNQEREVSFEVTPEGRSLVNLLFGGYGADCEQQQGLRRVEWSGVDLRLPGPVTIAEDRTFALQVGRAKLAGSFSPATATGTMTVQYEYEIGGHMWKCASVVSWTVRTPAPPPWQALPGKYCGLTARGEGVCADVPADGREVGNIDAGVVFDCGEVDIVARITIAGPVPLHSDLSFLGSSSLQLADVSTRVSVSGSFDRAGSMTGRVIVPAVAFTHQGSRYTCRNGFAGWTAKRQS